MADLSKPFDQKDLLKVLSVDTAPAHENTPEMAKIGLSQ